MKLGTFRYGFRQQGTRVQVGCVLCRPANSPKLTLQQPFLQSKAFMAQLIRVWPSFP